MKINSIINLPKIFLKWYKEQENHKNDFVNFPKFQNSRKIKPAKFSKMTNSRILNPRKINSRFLPFVNISIGARDMFHQSLAPPAKMRDTPVIFRWREGGGQSYFWVRKQVELILTCFTTRCQRFLLFVNISLGAQDMFLQTSVISAVMYDIHILSYCKNHAQNET